MNAVVKQLHDAPAAPGSKVVEYSRTEVALADLRARFSNVVFDVKTTSGDKDARVARAEIKGYRTALETMRVDLKAPLLDRQRLIDAEAKRITAELIALEEPIDAQIKLEEKRKADEKAAKAKEEANRIAATRAMIDDLRNIPVGLMDATPERLANAIADVEEYDVTPEAFAEFVDAAHIARTDVLAKLREMRSAAIRRAEEAAQLAAERAALAKQRAEQDERERQAAAERAEQERKDREAREAEEAQRREVQRKADEAMRAERETYEKRMAEVSAEIARQQAALDADRQRIADEAAARQREADEAAAAAQRDRDEAARIEAVRVRAEQDAKIAEVKRREREQFALNGPSTGEIIEALAERYDVDCWTVSGWLCRHVWAEVEVAA